MKKDKGNDIQYLKVMGPNELMARYRSGEVRIFRGKVSLARIKREQKQMKLF